MPEFDKEEGSRKEVKSSGVNTSRLKENGQQRPIHTAGFRTSALEHRTGKGPGSQTEVAECDIDVNKDLGDILLIGLSMERYLCFPLDDWFCQYVHVTSPSGQIYQFPFYQWISKLMTVEIPEGKGVITTGNTPSALKRQRQIELEKNREIYRWKVYAEGVPSCIDVANDEIENLPPNDQLLKEGNFGNKTGSSGFEITLKGFTSNTEPWHKFEDIRMVSFLRRTHISDIVSEIWKEDSFFGSQYLNGINPTLIRKCFKIPENFPVDERMVASSLGTSTNLNKELQDGNIYLADYEILEKIPSTNIINGKPQYIAAPLCLLWKNSQDQLVPIAIQLSQTPGDDAPVFLPGDSENDWLLAKIWVRNAECQLHEFDAHFLRTHLLAEVFSIATLRQLSMGHPVYKLIIPHLRHTLGINVFSRKHIVGPKGLFDQKQGVPSRLESKASLIKYLTMMIFTCSAQHSAVNNGQLDYFSWMPNCPSSMNSPPPKAKGVTTMETILKALPDVSTTAVSIITFLTISKGTLDRRCLGNYPDVRFTENTIQKFIKKFQDRLAEISTFIQERNRTMHLPYYYLDPSVIENSVSM
ncbi:arachidonate 12-lipoxygenase, 12R-type-like [Pyxicephalus adspersus]|uniref:arachidonate 12-lipoxygenase, 12R-type-like n=1 Tax=Pyxicephalus adspersus TaxID=30357 RepID=UPI003B5C0D31